jgi:phosphoglycerate dehydrogenase-like enzyme
MPHRVLWLTERGERHQQHALAYAPSILQVHMLRQPAEPDLLAALAEAEFLISERNQPVTAAMIEAAPNLRMIVRLGSLSHDIDLLAAEARGIDVLVQPLQGVIYCAEHALLLILALAKRLGRSLAAANAADHGQAGRRTNEDVFAFNWMHYADIGGLAGKQMAIIGMGEIGVELARRLAPFGLATLYYNKRAPYPSHLERALGITFASFDECLSQADYLISLLPFYPETDYLNGGGLSAQRFNQMKRGAYVVHLGSGSVLDEMALAEQIRAGRLAGAALDTFEYEPLQADNPLIPLARDPAANVLLTPHTAAASASADRSGDYAPIVAWLAARQK